MKAPPVAWVLVAACAELALAAFGLVFTPTAARGSGLLGLAGVAVAQAFCVLAVGYGPVSLRRAEPVAVRTGVTVGAIAGLLYGAEGLAEYLSPAVTDASVTIGWIIVAGFAGSSVVAAVIASVRAGSVRAGVTAAFSNAITEYLVWYPTVLLCYYFFRTSTNIDRVWRAEGTYDDFARSGMTDLRAFVLQDFWGAGFFHLVAGLILAALLGTATAWAVRVLSRR
ncbi:hypothetical protein [Fodinicola feengrottensis]